MTLTEEELGRYSRQIALFGTKAQEKLKHSTVALVGIGGLGSFVATLLAFAGIGKLIIIDDGVVDLPDLNRQILYRWQDIGKKKVQCAKVALKAINPHIEIVAIDSKLDRSIAHILRASDAVVDCLDNWPARILLNDICVNLGLPLVHGGVRGLSGQVMVILPGKTACLRCILRGAEEKTKMVPILGATVGVIGSIQAMETIKILSGYGKPMAGKMLIFDGYHGEVDILRVERRPDCPSCGDRHG